MLLAGTFCFIFSLSENEISDDGASTLAELLKVNRSLKWVTYTSWLYTTTIWERSLLSSILCSRDNHSPGLSATSENVCVGGGEEWRHLKILFQYIW